MPAQASVVLHVQAAAAEDVDGSQELAQLQVLHPTVTGFICHRVGCPCKAVRSLRLLMTHRPHAPHLVLHHIFTTLAHSFVCLVGYSRSCQSSSLTNTAPCSCSAVLLPHTDHPCGEAVCHNNHWPHLAVLILSTPSAHPSLVSKTMSFIFCIKINILVKPFVWILVAIKILTAGKKM